MASLETTKNPYQRSRSSYKTICSKRVRGCTATARKSKRTSTKQSVADAYGGQSAMRRSTQRADALEPAAREKRNVRQQGEVESG